MSFEEVDDAIRNDIATDVEEQFFADALREVTKGCHGLEDFDKGLISWCILVYAGE